MQRHQVPSFPLSPLPLGRTILKLSFCFWFLSLCCWPSVGHKRENRLLSQLWRGQRGISPTCLHRGPSERPPPVLGSQKGHNSAPASGRGEPGKQRLPTPYCQAQRGTGRCAPPRLPASSSRMPSRGCSLSGMKGRAAPPGRSREEATCRRPPPQRPGCPGALGALSRSLRLRPRGRLAAPWEMWSSGGRRAEEGLISGARVTSREREWPRRALRQPSRRRRRGAWSWRRRGTAGPSSSTPTRPCGPSGPGTARTFDSCATSSPVRRRLGRPVAAGSGGVSGGGPAATGAAELPQRNPSGLRALPGVHARSRPAPLDRRRLCLVPQPCWRGRWRWRSRSGFSCGLSRSCPGWRKVSGAQPLFARSRAAGPAGRCGGGAVGFEELCALRSQSNGQSAMRGL